MDIIIEICIFEVVTLSLKYRLMTVATIRKKLKTYVDDVDDEKVKALYTLLEGDIEENSSFVLTKEHLSILDEEHALHVSGKTKSYSWEDTKKIIRGKKTM